MAAAETLPFQAETKRLLDIVIHSLYTKKEIFLRELISNASDAVDALRFQALVNQELLEGNDKFEVRLQADKKARTLTISDNGIGMTRDEVVKNIGTIARSGTRELREKLKENPQATAVELIGQFGVGFYSAFMVADKVTLVTRKAGEKTATKWESSGDGQFTIEETEKESRGTSITLHLKAEDEDKELEDYTDEHVVSRIVKRHSDFVAYPVYFVGEDGKVGEKPLNTQKPIWTRPKSEVTEQDYAEFYKHIAHDWEAPLETIPLKAEGTFEYQALLFLPQRAPFDLFFPEAKGGLQLYARRVLIIEKCEELLPKYLRFVRGIVDAADLPLNISRQMLQEDRHVVHIKRWLTKKVLETLKNLQESSPEKFDKLWTAFGAVLKEGVASDPDNEEKLTALLRFPSTADKEKLTSLKDYVARMKPEQKEIYFLAAESRATAETSPHLEAFREKGFEVLFFVEPIDELLSQRVTEFEEKKLRSVGKGAVDLDGGETEKKLASKEVELAPLLGALGTKLESHVKKVTLSRRLTKSPACLVGEEHELSPHFAKMLERANQPVAHTKRTLELNADHELVKGLAARFEKNREDPLVADTAELLLGYALIAEGTDLPDSAKFNATLANLMTKALAAS
jgi:molecular chaperone HtpG